MGRLWVPPALLLSPPPLALSHYLAAVASLDYQTQLVYPSIINEKRADGTQVRAWACDEGWRAVARRRHTGPRLGLR